MINPGSKLIVTKKADIEMRARANEKRTQCTYTRIIVCTLITHTHNSTDYYWISTYTHNFHSKHANSAHKITRISAKTHRRTNTHTNKLIKERSNHLRKNTASVANLTSSFGIQVGPVKQNNSLLALQIQKGASKVNTSLEAKLHYPYF